MTDYVTGEIRSAVLSGAFALRSRLDQRSLAEKLGVSVIPVRESLRQLEAEGLVKILPRRGAYVAGFSAEEIKDIALLRETLEGRAVALAVPNMGPPLLRRLKELNDRMKETQSAPDPSAWLEANRAWHMSIYQAAGSPLLLQIIGGLWDRTALYRQMYTSEVAHRMHSVADHSHILSACAAGDSNAAANAVAQHIRRSIDEILQSVSEPIAGVIRE